MSGADAGVLMSLSLLAYVAIIAPVSSFIIARKLNTSFSTVFIGFFAFPWGLFSVIAMAISIGSGNPVGPMISLLLSGGLCYYVINKIKKRNMLIKKEFSFAPGEQVRLTVEHTPSWGSIVLTLDGNEIGRINSRKEAEKGKSFPIEMGRSSLQVRRVSQYPFYGLQIDRDGVPLPGTFWYCERRVRGAAAMLVWSAIAALVVSAIQMADSPRGIPAELKSLSAVVTVVQFAFLVSNLIIGSTILNNKSYSLLRLAYSSTVIYLCIRVLSEVASYFILLNHIGNGANALIVFIITAFQVGVYLFVVIRTVLPHLRLGIEG